jgi:hypothetical protein
MYCGIRRTELILASQAVADQQERKERDKLNPSTNTNMGNVLTIHEEEDDEGIEPKFSHVMDYCLKIQVLVAQEVALCQQVLPPATCQRIEGILFEEFISQADAIIVQDQFDGLLYHFQHHNIPQVATIYNLLVVSGTDTALLIEEIKILLKEQTLSIIAEANKLQNPIIFVNAIHNLFQQYSQVIQQACFNNTELLSIVQTSIENVICSSSSAPKLLALYVDQLIRTALQTISATNPTINSAILSQNPVEHNNDNKYSPYRHPIATTYRNTLSPDIFGTKRNENDITTSASYTAALQARHRVFYELDSHIKKWLDMVKYLGDKDLYEENHRLLSVERLFTNIHQNYGYDANSLNPQQFVSLLSPNESPVPNTNGSMESQGSSFLTTASFPNAFSTAMTQGTVASQSTNSNALAYARARLAQGLGPNGTPLPNMGPNHHYDDSGSTRLFFFFELHPDVPLFILIEYYLCAKLCAPNGPQIPTQHIEFVLRDVMSSARLHNKFVQSELIKQEISTKWHNYIESINPIDPQSTVMNDDTDGNDINSDTHASDKPLTKSLYPIVSDAILQNQVLPIFIPTIVTQGVWNLSISPALPTVSVPRIAPGSVFNANSTLRLNTSGSVEYSVSDAAIASSLLTTSHILYPTLKIPFEVLSLLNIFQDRYTSVWYRGRKIVWNYAASSAVITASFKHPELQTVKTYDLICTFFQLLILHLFNYKEVYTYDEISDLTGIINPAQLSESTAGFNSALLTLSHPRVGILKKTPNTPQMDKTHQFGWNHSFYSPTKQFYIPKLNSTTISNLTTITQAVNLSNTNANTPSNISHILNTTDSISKQSLFRRETAVDAAIVRLLKQYKELPHSALITKVQETLTNSFVPDEAFIKQRIEQQIDQFNVERDPDDRKLYRYL